MNESVELKNPLASLPLIGRVTAKRKQKAPVTVIVGIFSGCGVFLASDSRTTKTDGTIRDDAQKIFTIPFKNGTALVAQAGNADLGTRAIEIMIEKSSKLEINDYRSVADLAQLAIVSIKKDIREQFKGSGEEFQKHCADYHFELMIAHCYAGKPYIFTLMFELGIANMQRPPYVAIGCGSTLASFLLSWFDTPSMTGSSTAATSVYVVEEVKKHDPRCGGSVQLATCGPGENGSQSNASIINETGSDIAAEIKESVANEIRKEWSEKMRVVIDRVSNKWLLKS